VCSGRLEYSEHSVKWSPLQALGYLAPPEQRAEMAGLDAKDGIALYARLQEARQLAQRDRWDQARTLLEDVLATAPANVTARNLLALAAVRGGDLDEAERHYLRPWRSSPPAPCRRGARGAGGWGG
jgi:Tfp pilus assembly protein PilF